MTAGQFLVGILVWAASILLAVGLAFALADRFLPPLEQPGPQREAAPVPPPDPELVVDPAPPPAPDPDEWECVCGLTVEAAKRGDGCPRCLRPGLELRPGPHLRCVCGWTGYRRQLELRYIDVAGFGAAEHVCPSCRRHVGYMVAEYARGG